MAAVRCCHAAEATQLGDCVAHESDEASVAQHGKPGIERVGERT